MEARGAVNQYVPYPVGWQRVSTINLASGVTPFLAHFDGQEYSSVCYRLSLGVRAAFTITHAWYRPRPDEFRKLDASVRQHVLNGGLLCLRLEEAVDRQLPGDAVEVAWSYDRFGAFCQETYGERHQSPAAA